MLPGQTCLEHLPPTAPLPLHATGSRHAKPLIVDWPSIFLGRCPSNINFFWIDFVHPEYNGHFFDLTPLIQSLDFEWRKTMPDSGFRFLLVQLAFLSLSLSSTSDASLPSLVMRAFMLA